MAVGVASTGIHQTTNIKFSLLRREFKTISPRTTFDGSDDHSGDTGSVSASELLRNTSLSAADPVVPDVDENSNIATTESNWNISGFKNAIKYYYLNQTDIDDNDGEERVGFSVTDPSINSAYSGTDFLSWKESIGKNILKKAFINGVVGSLSSTREALSVGDDVLDINNLNVSIAGSVFGSAGYGDGSKFVTLTLPSAYSFPLGAAVTQYTGVGTYVAIGIVTMSTNNSTTVQLIKATDYSFNYYLQVTASSTGRSYEAYKTTSQLFVNGVGIGIIPSAVSAETVGVTSAHPGGNAIAMNLTAPSNNIKLDIISTGATVYAGGGGGGDGGDGGNGGQNGPQTHPTYGTGPIVAGAPGLEGGFGGIGRGYLSINRIGTDNPDRGKPGYKWPPGVEGPSVPNTPNVPNQSLNSGAGGSGGDGGNGGTYGDTGELGSKGGTGGTGDSGARWIIGGANPGQPGQPGQPGSYGSVGGKSIYGTGWTWGSSSNTDTVDGSRQIYGDYDVALPSP